MDLESSASKLYDQWFAHSCANQTLSIRWTTLVCKFNLLAPWPPILSTLAKNLKYHLFLRKNNYANGMVPSCYKPRWGSAGLPLWCIQKAARVDGEAAVLCFPPPSPMVSLCLSLRSHCIPLPIECPCWRHFLLLLCCWLHPYCVSATPRSAHPPSYLPSFN